MSNRSKRNKLRGLGEQAYPDRGQSVAMKAEYHRGPLPPPEMLERYEQIYPGTAERILLRFEKEAEHRQSMEHKIVDAQIEKQHHDALAHRLGQCFAFTIAVIGLTVSGGCVYHAQSTGLRGRRRASVVSVWRRWSAYLSMGEKCAMSAMIRAIRTHEL